MKMCQNMSNEGLNYLSQAIMRNLAENGCLLKSILNALKDPLHTSCLFRKAYEKP